MKPNNSNHKDPIIEYLFKDKSDDECFSSLVTDEYGNRIGYLNLENGTKVACYQAANKSPIIEIDVNGYQVLYIKNYKSDLACRKVLLENDKMLIYLYNNQFEIIEMYEEDS
jgi:hypothetical protein